VPLHVLADKDAESFRGAGHLRRIQEAAKTIVNDALAASSQSSGTLGKKNP
jgi:hypothetical protein